MCTIKGFSNYIYFNLQLDFLVQINNQKSPRMHLLKTVNCIKCAYRNDETLEIKHSLVLIIQICKSPSYTAHSNFEESNNSDNIKKYPSIKSLLSSRPFWSLLVYLYVREVFWLLTSIWYWNCLSCDAQTGLIEIIFPSSPVILFLRTKRCPFFSSWKSKTLSLTFSRLLYLKGTADILCLAMKCRTNWLEQPRKLQSESGNGSGECWQVFSWPRFLLKLIFCWQPYSAFLQFTWTNSITFSIAQLRTITVGELQVRHFRLILAQQSEQARCPFVHWNAKQFKFLHIVFLTSISIWFSN